MKLFLALLATLWPLLTGAETLTGRVVGVADGDTITVLDPQNQQHRVRLAWIDAPEKGQAYGQKAKENLSHMIYGKAVAVFWEEKDRYGRIIGKVTVDELDAGREQLRSGLAWHYKKYADKQPPNDRRVYAAAEDEARVSRRGLWADGEPVPPWEWRKK